MATVKKATSAKKALVRKFYTAVDSLDDFDEGSGLCIFSDIESAVLEASPFDDGYVEVFELVSIGKYKVEQKAVKVS